MPVTVSYPGVYVQEIPSGQQTIGGVATSITAFVGRTYRGPVNQARMIYSFGDFQRYFGGLVNGFPLGFAVRDFFQNGGSQAIVVRIYGPYWLEFPLQTEQQNAAANAAKTVLDATTTATDTSSDIASLAEAAAASFAGGTLPEQYAAASWMAAQASNWATQVGNAEAKTLQGYLGQVSTQMTAGTAAVLAAIQSPTSYPTVAFPEGTTVVTGDTDPGPDPNTVTEVALSAAAAQIPGVTQDAAYIVANEVLGTYTSAASPTFATLLTAAQGAQTDVGTALTALEGVAVTTTTTADAYTAGLANEAGNPGWKPTPKVQANAANAALIATNAVLAQVLPAFQLDAPLTYSESAAATELNSTYLNQLYDGGATTSPAVAAAVPASTASIQLQVPLNFLAVAEAANSVATSAWVAAMGVNSKDPPTTQGMAVSTAASETAAYVTSTSQALPQASKAAKAVANAVASALTQGAAAAATAGSMAVSAAVASALNLPTTNGAIVALLSGEQVAVAAWTAGSPTTVAAAVSAAPSLPAAQAAVGPYSDLGASPTAEAGGMAVSGPLVTNIAGALPTLTLYAANAGEWANGSLTVALNTNGITSAAASAMQLTAQPGWAPFGPGDFFNLVVGYTAPDGSSLSESWNMVSLRPDAAAQRIDRVLANSILIQYWWPGYVADSTYPTGMPGPLPVSGAWGMAGVPALPLPPLYGAKPGSLELALSLSDALLQGTPSAPLQMTDYLQDQSTHTGIYALDLVDQFDLMCIPPDLQVDTLPPTLPNADPTDQWRLELYQTAAVYCQGKYAMLILDPPSSWTGKAAAGNTAGISINDLGTYGPEGEYAAVYFPLLVEGNPTLNGQLGYFAPSGAIAGIMARTDASRGVWKAPAGINDGAISGTAGLELKLSDADSGLLNPQGINCLRTFPTYGNVVWGARTLKGADVLNSDYKYVPVRRLALYIEASLLRGLQWAVFEPNADPLWSSIRLSVNSFMNTLFRQGAFAGATAKDAYFVACDATTTTQTDIEQGIVNVTVGFAPLLPAEFVVITIQQMAGQTPT